MEIPLRINLLYKLVASHYGPALAGKKLIFILGGGAYLLTTSLAMWDFP
jgi:hypothetical protein